MKIALLTPSRDGRAHLDHSEAVAATRIEALRRGRPLIRLIGKGSANLPRNRNLLAAEALAQGADILLWVDCDIAFNPADVFRLADLAQKHGVVAALPQARTHDYGEQARIAGVLVNADKNDDGLIEAKALPTAFMAVRADVFQTLIDEGRAKEFVCPAAPHLTVFNWFFYELRPCDEQPGKLQDDAEDYYFCRKWSEVGGKLWAVPDMRLAHYEGLVRHSLCLEDVIGAQDGGDEG